MPTKVCSTIYPPSSVPVLTHGYYNSFQAIALLMGQHLGYFFKWGIIPSKIGPSAPYWDIIQAANMSFYQVKISPGCFVWAVPTAGLKQLSDSWDSNLAWVKVCKFSRTHVPYMIIYMQKQQLFYAPPSHIYWLVIYNMWGIICTVQRESPITSLSVRHNIWGKSYLLLCIIFIPSDQLLN